MGRLSRPNGHRPRVGFLTESYAMGGTERSTTLLIQALDRARFEPVLICAENPDIDELAIAAERLQIEVVRTPVLAPAAARTPLRRGLGLARLLRDLDLDLVHIQMLGGDGCRFAVGAARLAGIRTVIVTVRGHLEHARRGWRRLAMRSFDHMVTKYTVTSHHNRSTQIEVGGRRADQIEVIYNAIDTEAFAHAMPAHIARRELGLPATGPVIAVIARFVPETEVENVLEMAAEVAARRSDVRFLIIGDGPDRPADEQIGHDLGIASRVLFTGHGADAAQLLAAADVVVMSSISETFGLVLAEAMAQQKPIVATQVGGIPELVIDGETATLVEPRNGHALATAVCTYLDDHELAARHGAAGRRRVHEQFALPRLADDIHSLYDRNRLDHRVGWFDQPAANLDLAGRRVRATAR